MAYREAKLWNTGCKVRHSLHIIQNTKRHQPINGQVIYCRLHYHAYFGGRIEFSDNVGHQFFVIIIYFLEAYIKVMCLSAVGTDPFFLGLWKWSRSQWPRGLMHGLRPLACWDCGFESHWGYGCLSVVSVVCCQVEFSTSGWSLVHRSLTECGVTECDREASVMRRPWPTGGCSVMGKKWLNIIWSLKSKSLLVIQSNFFWSYVCSQRGNAFSHIKIRTFLYSC